MYYYCKKSQHKIVHLAKCHHIKNADISNISSFNNIVEAEEKGYRVCKHCAGLRIYLQKEKAQIQQICKDSGISVNNRWAHLHINTVYDQWKIIFDEERNCLKLFHKNSYETGKHSLIPYYHCQNFESDTLSDYLDYIIKHDDFRQTNPLRIKQRQPKAQKGTKRYKKEQEKKAYNKHRRSVKTVLDLIDSLHTKQTISSAMVG